MNAPANRAAAKRWRIPPFVIGALVGVTLWGISLLLVHSLDSFESAFPKWMRDLDLIDGVGSICMVIVYPLAIGGWLLIWGDGDPPVDWVDSVALNFAVGFCIMTVVGAAMGHFVPRVIGRQLQPVAK